MFALLCVVVLLPLIVALQSPVTSRNRGVAVGLFGNSKKSAAPAPAKPTTKSEGVAFGSSKLKPSAKPTNVPTVQDSEKGLLYNARRITRWIMFPGIFNDFDATEERMKKTIKIEKKMSKGDWERLRERNPEMYDN